MGSGAVVVERKDGTGDLGGPGQPEGRRQAVGRESSRHVSGRAPMQASLTTERRRPASTSPGLWVRTPAVGDVAAASGRGTRPHGRLVDRTGDGLAFDDRAMEHGNARAVGGAGSPARVVG